MRTGSQSLQLIERSRLTSAFSTIREFGTFAEGRIRAGSRLDETCRIGGHKGWLHGMGGRKPRRIEVGRPVGVAAVWAVWFVCQYRQADLVREVQPRNSDEYRDDWVNAAVWLFGP